MWTPDQVRSILLTSEANASNYAIDTIRRVVKSVYEDKKAQRQNLDRIN
jgi:hypothetical protein